MGKNKSPKPNCFLPDITEAKVQTFSQTVGYQISKHNIPDIWLETEGEGITVAILDTGCQMDHADLKDALIAGHNFDDNTDNINDGNRHGTHVTGIITANNNVQGIVGVAPKAKVLVIKVLNDNGSGFTDSVAKGILFALEQDVDIISMSLGGPESDPIIHDAIKKAYSDHIPVICAAGNSGDIGNLDYPARYPETISIGALNNANIRAEFSQTGERLDFMAPGAEILSTVPTNAYRALSGTSMACPWAAGVVALMIAKHRKTGGLTPIHTVEDVREHLRKTAIDLDVAGKDPKTGYGLIDVKKVIEQIQQGEKEMPVEDLKTKLDAWVTAYTEKQTRKEQLTTELAALDAELAAFDQKAAQITAILDG